MHIKRDRVPPKGDELKISVEAREGLTERGEGIEQVDRSSVKRCRLKNDEIIGHC